MTNTKFRKRALLSSVAMLLVALVALGSATFAWFTSDPTAKANGLSITTTTAAGLVIDTEYDNNNDFTHNETLNAQPSTGISPYPAQIQMDPASLDLSKIGSAITASNFFKTVADDDDEPNADESKPVEGTTAAYEEEIYAKLSGNTTDAYDLVLDKIVVTKAGSTTAETNAATALEPAVRVAIVYDGVLKAVYAPTAKSDASYLKATGTYAASSDGVLTAFATSTTLGSCTTTPKTVKAYVYLDGEDAACYTNNVSTSLAGIYSNVELQFKVVAHA